MEEEKSKKGLYIIMIIVLTICLLGSGFFIYKRILVEKNNETENEKNEDNLLSNEEAITLGKEKFLEFYTFMNSHPTRFKYEEMDEYKNYKNSDLTKKLTEEGLLYNNYFYLSDNFEQKFYSVFSKNVKIEDIFYSENDEYVIGQLSRYALIDNKYYVDTECRSGGILIKLGEFNVKNQTINMIDYSFILISSGDCEEECITNVTKELQLIKEDNNWKINKISEFSPCEYME